MLHIYMLCFASGPLAIKIIVVLTNALCPRSLEKSLCERDVRGDIFFFFQSLAFFLCYYVLCGLTLPGVLLGSGIE